MLRVIRSMAELPFGKLMEIYAQTNRERGQHWSEESEERRIVLAEQEFYAYLRQCFFTRPDSQYFLWEVDSRVVSALRCESYRDGVLLMALETNPAYRGRGYAKSLLEAVIRHLGKGNIYVHIRRGNSASLSVHQHCGFVKVKSGARMLDGSYLSDHDTYLLKL